MALLASLSIIAAACGDDKKESSSTTPSTAPDTTTADTGGTDTTEAGGTDYQWTPNADLLAAAEGQVNIVVWAGYAEDGSTDPAYDWVHPFEELTSCTVNVKNGGPAIRWCSSCRAASTTVCRRRVTPPSA